MPVGPLIIVSGPSGSGKSTLIRRALNQSGSEGALDFPETGVVCRLRLSRAALA